MPRSLRTRVAVTVAATAAATAAVMAVPVTASAAYNFYAPSVNRNFYNCTTIASYSDGIRWSTCTGGLRYRSNGAFYAGTNCVVSKYYSNVLAYWSGAC
jgi:hypothetical protein